MEAQTVLVFTELTISEEASLSGGSDINVQGGYAVGGSVSVGDSSSGGAVAQPGVVIINAPFPQLKDVEKAISKIKLA